MEDFERLRYPIGKFECPSEISKEDITNWIEVLEKLPEKLRQLTENFSKEQLETPYRSEGWTVRQVIHHLADSHHHSYTRFKWALSENRPLIKAYDEKEWNNMVDAKSAPIELSLNYLGALHAKLVYFLKRLAPEDFKKSYIHPYGNVNVSVAENIGKYAWHGSHHFAQIQNLAERKGW